MLANDVDRIEILSVGPMPGPPNTLMLFPSPHEVADSLLVKFDRPISGWGPESFVVSGGQSGYMTGSYDGEGTDLVKFSNDYLSFPGEAGASESASGDAGEPSRGGAPRAPPRGIG